MTNLINIQDLNKVNDLIEQVKNITSLYIDFKGALTKDEFDEMLHNGEVFKNECYVVDDAIYIGDICIDEVDRDAYRHESRPIRSDSNHLVGQLKSYTCTHCGGSIDNMTLQCNYCGVKYFFMLNIKCCKLTYARIPEYLYYYEDYKTLETVIILPDRSEFRVPMNIYYTIQEIKDE